MNDTHENTESNLRSAVIIVMIHSLPWAAVLLCLSFVVPEHKRIFRDFKIELSLHTAFVVAASDWMRNYWYVASISGVAIAVIDGAILFVLGMAPALYWLRRVWAATFFLLPLLLLILGGVSIYLTLMSLREGIGR